MAFSGDEVRAKFLEYFQNQKHKVVKSSPLIPAKDPSLLFVNAGMVQFKNCFLGQEDMGAKRAASSQKCLRVSGKHNDFENVGRTARHHTFFEMLGNFSFGDYFKSDAIRYAYEFLIDWMKLDPDKLWVTIFDDDDEAFELWQSVVDWPRDRIVRFGEKDNFWSMGDTGPCGPCSEIHYDQGPEFGTGPQDVLGGEGDRYLEIWNLVFMQYDRDINGVMTPLPKPSIDTGMGLERITAILQGKATNYDSDLFTGIHKRTEKISGKTYGDDKETTISMRVIADHARAATFLIGDGVLPSNEGRGYVLRRIIRRALRHGVLIQLNDPFLHKVSSAVVDVMGKAYPELTQRKSYIEKIIKHEEKRFLRTLENGLKILNREIGIMEKSGLATLDGELAFKLYDTYGFPLDLTEDIGRDRSFSVDLEGFDKALKKQRETSAKGAKLPGEEGLSGAMSEIAQAGVESEFTGYETLKDKSRVLGLIVNQKQVQGANEGEMALVIVERTPFYAEMGGQVGDKGIIENKDALFRVESTYAPAAHLIVHKGKVVKGRMSVDDTVTLAVDPVLRKRIMANHTATHLLHHALRQTLGHEVKQAGSLVGADRLRFDFTYFAAVKQSEILIIEKRVNEMVEANRKQTSEVMDFDDAVNSGAIALFGEKYPDAVRVVTVGETKELCGGTHLDSTGKIGPFIIVSESSIAAGVRRIEAITGQAAVEYIQKIRASLGKTSDLLKVSADEVADKVEKLLADNKTMAKKLVEFDQKMSARKSQNAFDDVREIKGIKALAAKVEVRDGKALRTLAANMLDKMGGGVLALGANTKGRALVIVLVSKELTDKLSAADLIGPIAAKVGGKGGGKADMAQAGGSNPDNLDSALEKLYDLL